MTEKRYHAVVFLQLTKTWERHGPYSTDDLEEAKETADFLALHRIDGFPYVRIVDGHTGKVVHRVARTA